MSGQSILLVENNPDNMTLITDVLRSLNYTVIQASDGQQGVTMAEAEKPDLILMDLSLPQMDGWTATRLIKANPDLSKTPVIALTAHAMIGDRERAIQAGCDDYLTKPINLRELATKLTQYLGEDSFVKILVADDNPDSRQLTRDIVASMGHEVVTAVDGPRALAAIQEQMPDLVILDVNMPGMSGFDVMSALKADEATAQIPVLMLTALADVENRVIGLGLGADDYLSKPFNPRELVARVNTRLRAKGETDDLRATQEMIRSTFERFVAPQVVERLLRDPLQVKLGGTLQEVTIMFADLEGFTSISEFTEPEMLLSVLNHYHTLIVNIIQRYGGTIDKFIGDGVMALYNTPLAQKDHALRAVRTALQIREALPKFYEDFEPDYQMRINFGIHTGMAVVGNVGTPQIMDFTAVGDTVNLAARLQDISDEGQILISLSTYEQVADHIAAQPVGYLDIKGRQEPVMAYTVLELAH